MQCVGHLFQLAQIAVQLCHCVHGHHQIGNENQKHRHGHKFAQNAGHHGHQLCNGGVNHLDHHHDQQPPQQRKRQADIPAQVERFIAIIPPLGVKQLFQRIPGTQLQRAGQQCAAHKKQCQMVLYRPQHAQHDQHAKPVNRAHRAIQKTSVDQLAGIDGAEDHLTAPAQHRINGKKPKQLVQAVPKN
ncbi:hypothetical protein SDC9_176762 [bioreactor metagenome]|uniref:Uncharacterized protein n=1 Tax=bioreactor metagenome TaxID=1076179 RepID=A0A645GSN9_9ZZZZ